MGKILITGAAGRIAAAARVALRESGAELRLLDLHPAADPHSSEEVVVADCADLEALTKACEGVDCLIHLAGVPTEAPWDELLPANVAAVYNAFEAARRAGVRRVVYASSNHAVGFHPVETVLDRFVEPRADSLYGAAKVFGESLGRLYAEKYGLQVCALRIGSFRQKPLNQRELRTWISPRDAGQLIRCCVEAPDFDYFVAYGLSRNTRGRWSNGDLDAWLGYAPEDDSEIYAEALAGPDYAEGEIAGRYHGGPYCDPAFKGSPR